jgi:hypothetical protein
MLPNTLSALDGYAVETIRWLKSVREKAQLLEQGQYANQPLAVATCPRPDTAAVVFLQDCVEHFDQEASHFVATLLSKQQVHNSRIVDLHDYLVNHPQYDVKQVGLAKNIDEFIASAVDLAANAKRLFPYARFETDAAPKPPDAQFAMAVFQQCHLQPHSDVNAWNVLTNRYPETAAAGMYSGPVKAS